MGSRRKTPADYHTLAEKRGFTWLGPEVPSAATKTTWQCANGHQWQAAYSQVRTCGCQKCHLGKRRKKPVDYHNLAEAKGIEWIGPEVRRITIKTGWRCPCGHEWQTSYGSLRKNKGCPRCTNLKQPKQPHDYHTLATQKGLIWLGPMVCNVSTPTTWQCSEGHQWHGSYHRLTHKRRTCEICDSPHRVPKNYETLARESGLTWLGPLSHLAIAKTGWQCPNGHIWYETYKRMTERPYCTLCRGRTHRFDEAYVELGRANGHEWLGPDPPARNLPTNWRCWRHHHWTASYEQIEAGASCPECEGEAETFAGTPAEFGLVDGYVN